MIGRRAAVGRKIEGYTDLANHILIFAGRITTLLAGSANGAAGVDKDRWVLKLGGYRIFWETSDADIGGTDVIKIISSSKPVCKFDSDIDTPHHPIFYAYADRKTKAAIAVFTISIARVLSFRAQRL